jgi:DNA-directed RNA polymerase II subunit RPB11
MSNTADFIMKKEDHTLGNLIAEHLKMAPHVLMAGYKGKQIRSSTTLRET